MTNLDEETTSGLDYLFARVAGQVEHGEDEVLYPGDTDNIPLFQLTWDLNRGEDQDRLIRQIIKPRMAEEKLHLVSRSKRERDYYQALWDQARAACLVIIEKPEDYDLQSFFDSLLSRVTAPADKESTRVFFRKVVAAVF